MGAWCADSKTNVATMGDDDFATTRSRSCRRRRHPAIVHTAKDGTARCSRTASRCSPARSSTRTLMDAGALNEFLAEQIEQAKADDVLFSVHLKATMMKVSDPIIFGHVVKVFFADVFRKYGDELAAAGSRPNDGLGGILAGLDALAERRRDQGGVRGRAWPTARRSPMVDSDKGITNLHVPSDVIIDASMPAMIRNGGKIWGVDGGEADTLAVIPDSSYAGVFQAVIDDCSANGALDPATIGSVPNVGLMAQAAEEYGSHDKTFEIPTAGTVAGRQHRGRRADRARGRRRRHLARLPDQGRPVQDWVKLAVTRARATGSPAVFWLDEKRAHDANHREGQRLPADHDTAGPRHQIIARRPRRARSPSSGCVEGEDTISVTGNVLRDYNTDLFPILELGHEGQDALGRAADDRRRSVRDRRRRLGAEARPAARRGELPALGQPRRVLRAGAVAGAPRGAGRQRRAPRSSPTPSTAPPARSSTRTGRPAASSARSTTAARTSTSRSTGPRSSPRRPTTPSSRRRSRRWPRRCARTRRRSSTS